MIRVFGMTAIVLMCAGCAVIGSAKVASFVGPVGADTVQVQIVDPRSGGVYEGSLPRTQAGAGPLYTMPVAAMVTGDASGVEVRAAWYQKTP